MRPRSPIEEWRDSQSPVSKGCGCAVLMGIGVLACAFLMGSVMGDYIGPPEGAAQDIHNKNITILLALGTLLLCGIAGGWLVSRRRS